LAARLPKNLGNLAHRNPNPAPGFSASRLSKNMLTILTMTRTDMTTGIHSWLLNSVAVLLIIATAAMGFMAGNMREQAADPDQSTIQATHPDIIKSHQRGSDGSMPAIMSAARMVCCPCETSEQCLAEPPDGFVLLSAALNAVNLNSLTSQPPAAPPRT